MKNRILFPALVAVCCFFSSTLKSQMSCPFTITNNRNCDIAVLYEVSDCLPSPSIICNNTYLVLRPGSVYTLPAGCCGGTTDVYVWLLEIDYINVTGGNNNQAVSDPFGGCFLSGSPGGMALPAGINPPCDQPAAYTVTWTTTGVIIN
jgi:hypothetical protein